MLLDAFADNLQGILKACLLALHGGLRNTGFGRLSGELFEPRESRADPRGDRVTLQHYLATALIS